MIRAASGELLAFGKVLACARVPPCRGYRIMTGVIHHVTTRMEEQARAWKVARAPGELSLGNRKLRQWEGRLVRPEHDHIGAGVSIALIRTRCGANRLTLPAEAVNTSRCRFYVCPQFIVLDSDWDALAPRESSLPRCPTAGRIRLQRCLRYA
jgi:hypothetical protein